jgi:hypothetical protein
MNKLYCSDKIVYFNKNDECLSLYVTYNDGSPAKGLNFTLEEASYLTNILRFLVHGVDLITPIERKDG